MEGAFAKRGSGTGFPAKATMYPGKRGSKLKAGEHPHGVVGCGCKRRIDFKAVIGWLRTVVSTIRPRYQCLSFTYAGGHSATLERPSGSQRLKEMQRVCAMDGFGEDGGKTSDDSVERRIRLRLAIQSYHRVVNMVYSAVPRVSNRQHFCRTRFEMSRWIAKTAYREISAVRGS
jgi:hypothetical protein